jgi:hypothetical protein
MTLLQLNSLVGFSSLVDAPQIPPCDDQGPIETGSHLILSSISSCQYGLQVHWPYQETGHGYNFHSINTVCVLYPGPYNLANTAGQTKEKIFLPLEKSISNARKMRALISHG